VPISNAGSAAASAVPPTGSAVAVKIGGVAPEMDSGTSFLALCPSRRCFSYFLQQIISGAPEISAKIVERPRHGDRKNSEKAAAAGKSSKTSEYRAPPDSAYCQACKCCRLFAALAETARAIAAPKFSDRRKGWSRR